MNEYKEIPGYEGQYAIRRDGVIWSYKRKRALIPHKDSYGYYRVSLCVGGKQKSRTIHRLLMLTYTNKPADKTEINHINGIKTDNRIENLEWVTKGENTLHAMRTGLIDHNKVVETARKMGKIYGKRAGMYKRKLTPEQVRYIRANYVFDSKEWGAKALANIFNVAEATVQCIVNGKHYADIK